MSGKLLIVGGSLSTDNYEIFEHFIKMAGGKEHAIIGIIPAASISPLKSGNMFKSVLINNYGISDKQIEVLPIHTSDYNENILVEKSKATSKFEEAINTNLEKFSGIWITGGDQRKIAQLLYFNNGEETPLLKAIKKKYISGCVIAGTSAGAAVMSEYIITGGTSNCIKIETNIQNFYEIADNDYTTLSIGRGLGLFRYGIIDQHFMERDRLCRLAAAAYMIKGTNFGFGVDEDTAIILDSCDTIIKVLGKGGLTVLDATNANYLTERNLKVINNIKMHYLLDGDEYDLKSNCPIYKGQNIKHINKLSVGNSINITPKCSFDAFDKYLRKNICNNPMFIGKMSYSYNDHIQKVILNFNKGIKSNIYIKNHTSSRFSMESIEIGIEIKITEENTIRR